MKKLKFKPEAIIFDMDGVIVDSMPYHYLAWYEALRSYGVRVTCFDVYSKEGERWQKSLEDFLKRAHIEPSRKIIDKIFIERQKIFKRYFKRFIFKGVKEFLLCLKNQGYVLGLVTGTPTSEVKKILSKNIRDLFSGIVGGDNVKKGKPNPDPYLKAARMFKVRPGECLVVENAPYGIESAKRAGMFCIALATSLPKEYLCRADIVVNDLEEITGIIEQSCRVK
ncbi:MAG: HAD family phosphatase [Candidatus Omnitrophica bacterium]|nr:HAD family phosphatase [Candidatus Omnitrophota bacterium]MBU1928428.1 HAD family phosphatase [Candidatus Omnitrophota bacterium]MBU2034310.1 HAD family phosphatase [Candidatus Omnitrophota bacterium]MBU2222185.1 HAD family phosphatase [Candidatus Omnitrophota bacterium]MBU2258326.1 HAD family phosphatase [Candidatus Omnitrophota bacterium]